MTVIAASAVPDHLRGALTRWMLEVTPQMYVGCVSAKVRGQPWTVVSQSIGDGIAVLVHPDNNEQGFSIHTAGHRRRRPTDFDGLTLMAFEPYVTEQSLLDNEIVDW
jgi:CRISPR-associated protein Cas2